MIKQTLHPCQKQPFIQRLTPFYRLLMCSHLVVSRSQSGNMSRRPLLGKQGATPAFHRCLTGGDVGLDSQSVIF